MRLALPILVCAAALAAEDPAASSTAADGGFAETRRQASYLVGLNIANGMRAEGLDLAVVAAALQDQLAGKPPAIDPAKGQEIFAAFQAGRDAERKKAGEGRSASNKEYLDKHGQEKGVTTTASGLQYEVLSQGDAKGKQPAKSSTVRVNYEGKLLDGTVFDASAKHGGPAQFRLDQVISGWTEGLQLMRPGDKYRFTIPANLAYGENGPPGIGPNQVLVFEVELLEIK